MDIVRRSPAGLVFKIIFIEIAIEMVYLLLSTALVELRGELGSSYTSARILLSIVFMTLAVSVVVTLVAQWANEGYFLKQNELIVRRGIIAKTETAYPYANMQSVTLQQGFIGRLFNYGQISIFIPTLGKDIIFSEISNPADFTEKIKAHIPYPESGQFLIRK
jgi:uncharacterized membrane protein YdbT with pleckstrin-like domain